MRMCLKLGLRPQTPRGLGKEKDFIHHLKYPSLTSFPGIFLGPSSVPPPLKPSSHLFPWAPVPGLKFFYSLTKFNEMSIYTVHCYKPRTYLPEQNQQAFMVLTF